MEASKPRNGDPSTSVLERLAQRDALRKADVVKSRRERQHLNGDADGSASTDVLLPTLKLLTDGGGAESTFRQRNTPGNFLENLYFAKSLILSQLEEISQPDAADISIAEKIKRLDGILSQIEDLQRWFTESYAHLKAFHIEQARLEVDELKSKFHATREMLLPKKKFTFGSKAVKEVSPKKAPKSPLLVADTVPILKEPETKYNLSKLTDCPNLRLPSAGESEDVLMGQSIYLSNLTRCTIFVEGVSGSIMAHDLKECTIYAQPVASSILLQRCTGCRFVLACRQLRVHQTADTRMDIFVASPPIIEDSTRLQLAPYPLGTVRSPAFQANLTKANLAEATNQWRAAQDFSCPTLQTGFGDGSMNWSLVPEKKWDQGNIPTCPSY